MNNISIITKLRNKFRVQKSNKVELNGNNIKISKCKIIIKGSNNTLKIGNNNILRDITFEIIGNNCSISIGENTTIGHNSYLSAKENDIHLSIGENCMFSRNIKIMTSDGHPVFSNNDRINPAQNITIESEVWLADNVTILKGVTIGSGSIVGINSTLTKSVEKNTISVGNPAKTIKKNITWKP